MYTRLIHKGVALVLVSEPTLAPIQTAELLFTARVFLDTKLGLSSWPGEAYFLVMGLRAVKYQMGDFRMTEMERVIKEWVNLNLRANWTVETEVSRVEFVQYPHDIFKFGDTED